MLKMFVLIACQMFCFKVLAKQVINYRLIFICSVALLRYKCKHESYWQGVFFFIDIMKGL